MNERFNKTTFKRDVQENVRRLFRKELDEANPQEQFQAVSYAVKEAIIDNWIATQRQFDKDDPKIVYYMSMEFLMGRALGNNLINMTAYKEVKEALDELGIDLNAIEDQEPLGGLQHVSLILWHRWDMRLTAAESGIVTGCSSRRLRMAIRWKRRITG